MLTELRSWFAAVLAMPNDGRREALVLGHCSVCRGSAFDYGWSSWGVVSLTDGRKIVRGGPGPGDDLPTEVANVIYKHISKTLRGRE